MLISNTVDSSILKKARRFEPKFFLIDKLFDLYKESENFNTIRLGDPRLLKHISDGEHAGQKFVDKGILFIKNSSIKNFQISRYDGFYIEESKHEKQSKSALKKGDVLLTTIGYYLGTSTVVPEDLGEANINQNLVKMEINDQLIDPYYLSAYLNSKLTKNQIQNMFAGNIQPILTHKKLKDLYVVYPKDKTKSENIANRLRLAERCEARSIKLIEEALSFFNEKIQIDINDISKKSTFTIQSSQLRNIDDLWSAKYFKFNDSDELFTLSKNFNITDLNDAIELISGKEPGSSTYMSYMDKNIEDVPFIRTSDLFNYDIDMYPDNYIPAEINEKYNLDIKKGDILFTKDGKIGEVSMMSDNHKCLICAGISRIRVKESYKHIMSNEYLFTAMLSDLFKTQVEQRVVYSSTIPHLRPERLKTIKIPILDSDSMIYISNLIKRSFRLKKKKNQLIYKVSLEIEDLLNSID